MTEDNEILEEPTSTSAEYRHSLRTSISQFAYMAPDSPLRRSPGRATAPMQAKAEEVEQHALDCSPRRKRAFPDRKLEDLSVDLLADVTRECSPSPSKKSKRRYAAPEIYAHLRPLNDYLKADLDGDHLGRGLRHTSAHYS